MSESSRGGACFTPLHRGHGKRTRQSGLSRHGGIAQVSDSGKRDEAVELKHLLRFILILREE